MGRTEFVCEMNDIDTLLELYEQDKGDIEKLKDLREIVANELDDRDDDRLRHLEWQIYSSITELEILRDFEDNDKLEDIIQNRVTILDDHKKIELRRLMILPPAIWREIRSYFMTIDELMASSHISTDAADVSIVEDTQTFTRQNSIPNALHELSLNL